MDVEVQARPVSARSASSSEKLRLCIVGPLGPPEGGMATQTRQLAQKLAEDEGVGVEVVRTNAPYQPEWIGKIQGVRAIAREVPYLLRLVRAFRRCDVVHIMANSGWAWHLFAAPALWIARLCGKPAIVNYRGGNADIFLAKSAGIIDLSMRLATRLIVPSGYLKAVFARHNMQADIIPNIVDLTRFAPKQARRQDGAGPHIVVTRNLEPIYDNETAIRALALLRANGFPTARLTIAGTGPSRQKLADLAAELKVDEAIEFAGRLDRAQIVSLYQEADVALNPSLVDNMPNSVLEALACGVPVVSTNVGGVPYIVEHNHTALLIGAGNAQAMCDAIASVLRDRELAARLTAAGLAHVQQFGWPQVAPRWLATYRKLASEHR